MHHVDHILAGKGREVVSIAPGTNLGEAARLLHQHRIGAVVVLDGDGSLLGILSERDIVRALAKTGQAALEEEVSRHMTGKLVTCTGQSAINDLMGLMTQGKFRHIPVVEEGRLRGIVSIGDIVKHRLREVETEHQALKDYIATA